MTKRQWGVVATLAFLNAFILVVLITLLRQVYLTPREVAVATPTLTDIPTFTPLPTDTPTPLPTPTPLLTPTPTNTRVVPPATPTPTPTSTPTNTPTPPPPTPTPTYQPPTATPTFTPTPTPTPPWPYKGHGPAYEPSCVNTWIEGRVLDRDGTTGLSGVLVKLWTAGFTFPLLESGKRTDRPPGSYEFIIGAGRARPGTWWVALVDAGGTLISDVIMFQTTADCNWPDGQQKVIVDFVRQ